MAKFKNKGEECFLYKPAGHPDALRVDAGQTVEVAGEVTSETDDAYIVGEGDRALAFPKEVWDLGPQDSEPAEPVSAATEAADPALEPAPEEASPVRDARGSRKSAADKEN